MSETTSSSASAGTPCPVCGSPLPDAAPRGLCPRCLLAGAASPTAAEAASALGTASAAAPDPARIAAAFPQLEILGLIGAGGMGAVFKARQRNLDRVVALKILSESLATRPAFAERFLREARVLARLNHPNIVTVHDFGQADGFFFLVMEYVDGVNLRQAMHAGRFTPAHALELVPRLCEALQFAHDEGILHRDIKPENILLDTRGRVKIADFGIAKLLGDAGPGITLTASGAALGTPAYMAPEQIERPADVDHRADIYSLGVVLYEMLTGELPLGRFAAPSEKTPVDRRVDDLVFRALEKEREKRFQSANEVRTKVETLGPQSTATPPAAGTPPAAVPVAPRPDFILCHPALPRMGKALSVYGLILAPAMFLIGLAFLEEPGNPHPVAHWVEGLTKLFGIAGDLVGTATLFLGALLLRWLKPSAPRVLTLGLWLHLGTVILVGAGFVWVEMISPTPRLPSSVPAREVIYVMLGLSGLAFEVFALVWLYRHRDILDTALERGRSPVTGNQPAPTAYGPPPPTLPRATLSATLTLISLGLGVPAASALALWGVSVAHGSNVGGIGAAEVWIILVLGLVVLGLGVGGLVTGLQALHTIRERGPHTYGTRRAVLGACGWFLVLVTLATELAAGFAFFRFCDSPLTATFLTVIAALVATDLALRGCWRWITGNDATPNHPHGTRPPAWTHGLALAVVLLVTIALAPPVSVAQAHVFRTNLPPMLVALRGDPGIQPGETTDRSAMELDFGLAPRSIVTARTTLLRNGQPVRSPLYEFHFVNPRLEGVENPVLIRLIGPSTNTAGGQLVSEWELFARAAEHSVTYGYRADETTGVRWSFVGVPLLDTKPVGQSFEQEILHGRGPDGIEWSVVLRLDSEPLIPTIRVDEKTLVNSGRDWSATVREARLDPQDNRP